jgi:uncharacterized membrane protein
MQTWLPLALVALVAWSVQRTVSKAALAELSTPQFYLLSAIVSVSIYLPVVAFDPPPLSAVPPAIGVAALTALTFWVTTEAIRRGPIGRVSPITGVSPALTAILALTILGEHVRLPRGLGIITATMAVALLGYRREKVDAGSDWEFFAVASLVLQGLGAFLAKVVVTPSGPSALLVSTALVQVVVGWVLLRRSGGSFPTIRTRLMRWTLAILVLAALATIGYLFALSYGPASVIVPLVATSPALGGLLGAVVLKERTTRLQYVGIAFGLVGAVLLASPG